MVRPAAAAVVVAVKMLADLDLSRKEKMVEPAVLLHPVLVAAVVVVLMLLALMPLLMVATVETALLVP
jgi:hypothetical protein